MSNESLPSVSIIVVTFNSRAEIGACLTSLADHAPWAQKIVIDNDSSDGTADYVRASFPDVELIRNQANVGYGTAINAAVARSQGNLLVLLNPDAEITAGAIDRLAEVACRPNVGIVGPKLMLRDGNPQPSGRRFPSPLRTTAEVLRLHLVIPRAIRSSWLLGTYWDQSETREVDWVSGACHVFRRDVWNRVGPLTEATFCGFDDFDYCWRARQLGLQTWYCAEAEVVHGVGASVAQRWDKRGVDALAINNMYVLLESHWHPLKRAALAAAEGLAAVSDAVQAALHGETANVRLALARARLLLRFALGRRAQSRWGDPRPVP